MCIQYTDKILYRYSKCNILYKAIQTPKGSGEMVTTMRTKLGWFVTQRRQWGKLRCSVLCFTQQAHTVQTETWYNMSSSYTKKLRQVGLHGDNRNAYEQTNKVVLPRIQNVWFIYKECLYRNPCFHEFMPFFFSFKNIIKFLP